MSKKTKIKIPAKFAFLTDGAYIPAEMWKSLAAFTAHPKRDVRYYLCGFHLDRAMCAWQAANGHVAVSCKLSPAMQSDPFDPATLPPADADTTQRLTSDDLPAWLPAEGVTFMPPTLPKGTVQTRITPTQETAFALPNAAEGAVYRLDCYDTPTPRQDIRPLATLDLMTIGGHYPDFSKILPAWTIISFDTDLDTIHTKRPPVPTTVLNLGYLADLATILPAATRNRADFPGARFKMTGERCFMLLQSDEYNWATRITGCIMGMCQ